MKAMNEERPHRNFKGVWICAALWTHPKLSYNRIEKCLVAEVDSLTSDARPCYASNEFLAGKMQISPALRLRGETISIDDLIDPLIRRVNKRGNIGLIIIDSIYSLMGDREENANEDRREVYNVLHRLARETNAAVLTVEHHGKGDQSGKRS
ncbi:MAG TPA: AAA family ATPase, partial [Pyrinomonadaceae bacterium]|nr:AAA family ATPase [Pyrinomonadaceae bacterium]